jgi:hypothetical protein
MIRDSLHRPVNIARKFQKFNRFINEASTSILSLEILVFFRHIGVRKNCGFRNADFEALDRAADNGNVGHFDGMETRR